MLTFDRKALPIITLLSIVMTVVLTAEEPSVANQTLPNGIFLTFNFGCLLYTSDAADE